jgi:peroxiredoxin
MKLIFTFAALLAASALAAQTPVDPETDLGILTLKAAFRLTPEQVEQVVTIYSKMRADQAEALAADAYQQPRLLQAAREPFVKKMYALLTPEQREMWESVGQAIDLRPEGMGGNLRTSLRPDEGPEVGAPAPDFSLPDLGGKTVTLKSLRGKPTVVEFGSYSCPLFRNKVDDAKALRKEMGNKVNWVFIYGSESHPSDGAVAPINVQQGIDIPQHTSLEARQKCARLADERLQLGVRILVDSLDDRVTKAYAGAPHRAYVLDREGRIVSRQIWMEPETTRTALLSLLDAKAAKRAAGSR